MSTDYYVMCETCRKYEFLGTRFAGSVTFGESSKDEAGRERAMEFIVDHDNHELRIRSEHAIDASWKLNPDDDEFPGGD